MKNSTLISCTVWMTSMMVTSCSQSSQSIDSFSKEVYTPTYAIGFNITGTDEGESTIITVNRSWQGNDSTVTQLLIARNDEPTPQAFNGQIITNEAQRIVTTSSTHIAMLDALGVADRIVGVSGLHFVSTPSVVARKAEIADIGYDNNFDYEMLLAAAPDLVLLYGINSASQLETKLRELKIPFIYIGDYLEDSPLGKTEWLMVLAEITGVRDHGKKVWEPIPANYNRLKAMASASSANGGVPTVMLNTPYGDSWFMPPTGSYMTTLIADAGGDYLYKENNSGQSIPIDIEEAYLLTSRADYWLNVGQCTSLQQLKAQCPRMASTGCVTAGNVYNNTLRFTPGKGNDFYESGIMHPDLVLRDLIKIFHPELARDDEFTYYTKLE